MKKKEYSESKFYGLFIKHIYFAGFVSRMIQSVANLRKNIQAQD